VVAGVVLAGVIAGFIAPWIAWNSACMNWCISERIWLCGERSPSSSSW
jgi:hypothetical protein